MRRTRANWLGLAAICGTSFVGCTMSMSGGAYPPRAARQPVMSPTAGYYAPMPSQTVNSPVPVAVMPMSTIASTATPTVAPTTASAPTIASTPMGPRTTAVYYHVNQGDTLSAIAQRYQTTVEDIRNANKISGNNELSPGQMVLIPNSGTAIR